jgi:hypothetical protein
VFSTSTAQPLSSKADVISANIEKVAMVITFRSSVGWAIAL